MKDKLKQLDNKKILFFDIETSSVLPTITPGTREFDLFRYKRRDNKTDALLSEEETIAEYKRTAALSPIYGKIVSISIGMIKNDDTIYLKTFSGDEAKILKDFVELVNSLSGYLLCAWNIDFDIPYIRKRFVINGLTDYLSDACGNDSMEKPWTIRGLLDLMAVWKGISFYNDSLDEVSYALGVKSPKSGLKGAEVSAAYHSGRLDEIIKYNEEDVVALINIFQKLTERNIIEGREYSTKEVEKVPMLKKLSNGTKLSKAEQTKLDKEITKLSDKQKDMATEILDTLNTRL
jgi:predicted PolB exonuclease-like 3'-5' exonuclease